MGLLSHKNKEQIRYDLADLSFSYISDFNARNDADNLKESNNKFREALPSFASESFHTAPVVMVTSLSFTDSMPIVFGSTFFVAFHRPILQLLRNIRGAVKFRNGTIRHEAFVCSIQEEFPDLSDLDTEDFGIHLALESFKPYYHSASRVEKTVETADKLLNMQNEYEYSKLPYSEILNNLFNIEDFNSHLEVYYTKKVAALSAISLFLVSSKESDLKNAKLHTRELALEARFLVKSAAEYIKQAIESE